MKKCIASGILILSFFYFSISFCEEQKTDAAVPQDSIYSYSESDLPKVFFFPKEKARWDGSKVTMKEWYMLTDLQKERFISEYLGELKKQYKAASGIIGLEDYIRALNIFSYYSNDKSLNEPSVKFIDKLLEGQERSGQKVLR